MSNTARGKAAAAPTVPTPGRSRSARLARELAIALLVDEGRLLEPPGRLELDRTMQALRARGLRAVVLLLPRGEDLGPHQALWEGLRLQEPQDLLLLFSGHNRWWARGWGLDATAIESALARAEPALAAYYARGLVAALEQLAGASGRMAPVLPADTAGPAWGGSPAPPPAPWGRLIAAGGGLMLLAGGAAWIIARRRRVGSAGGSPAPAEPAHGAGRADISRE